MDWVKYIKEPPVHLHPTVGAAENQRKSQQRKNRPVHAKTAYPERRFAAEQVRLSRRLWQMVLGLTAMPLCALVAVVLLTFQKYHSDAVNTLAMNQGLVVLPFVLLTSIVLLFAVLILADHQRLERANQLSGLREIYYQGLRQQESQVRQLRHDLRNHLTVIQGLLEKSDP